MKKPSKAELAARKKREDYARAMAQKAAEAPAKPDRPLRYGEHRE